MDPPEKGEPGAAKAIQALRNLIQRKEGLIDTDAHDQWGRSVANVKVGGKSVNKAMRHKLKK